MATRGEAAAVVALGCGLPLAALLLLGAVCGLASGGATAALPIPLGPPGLAGTLALDPVGLAFLLPLAVVAACAFAVGEPEDAAPLLGGLGAALLTLVAGDAFLLALGIGLAALAAGAALRIVLLLGLVAAVASLAPHAGLLQGDAFTALRSARGAGAGVGAALVFPCGIAAGLLLLWPAGGVARGPGSAMFRDAGLPLLGLFLLVRLLFDLGAQPTPVWAALLLVLLAAAGGLLAGSTRWEPPTSSAWWRRSAAPPPCWAQRRPGWRCWRARPTSPRWPPRGWPRPCWPRPRSPPPGRSHRWCAYRCASRRARCGSPRSAGW